MRKIKERPDQVKRAIRALIKANNYIRKNREGTIRVLVDWAKTKPELAAASYDSSWEFLAMTQTFPRMDYASLSMVSEIPWVSHGPFQRARSSRTPFCAKPKESSA